MNRFFNWKYSILLAATHSLVACGSGSEDVGNVAEKPANTAPVALQKPGSTELANDIQSSPGKISAPISIDYSIMGNPVVGLPVGINIQISSPLSDRAITVHYRVNEFGSLTFPETQVESVSLLPLADSTLRSQQVTVVPQREGRLYLVVSAEIDTDGGTMMQTMAVPIQVGRAPRETTANGRLVEGVDGEAGVSMPANEP
jgi:hypothetical protein